MIFKQSKILNRYYHKGRYTNNPLYKNVSNVMSHQENAKLKSDLKKTTKCPSKWFLKNLTNIKYWLECKTTKSFKHSQSGYRCTTIF